jgi:hypothetical protein
MAKFYLTFGVKYAREAHPTFPRAHPNGYVVIEADVYEDAREKVIEVFGIYWCDLYTEYGFLNPMPVSGVPPIECFPAGEIDRFTVDPLDIFDRNDSL